MYTKPAIYFYQKDIIGCHLTGAKSREWMGCWGLLGLLLIVSQWIIPSFPTKHK